MPASANSLFYKLGRHWKLIGGILLFSVVVRLATVATAPPSESTASPAVPGIQIDEAAKLIAKCGPASRDFVKTEGGQPIRHIVYSKQNVELMYSHDKDKPLLWQLVGIFSVRGPNADDALESAEGNRRLSCAEGGIRYLTDDLPARPISPMPPPPPPPNDDFLSAEACVEAQNAVRNVLKAPSTAKFPGCVLGLGEYQIRADADRNTFWVFGYVDSQNSFGAMLRSKFGVQLSHSGSSWTAVKVSID